MSRTEQPTDQSSPPTLRVAESDADLAVAVDTLAAAFYDDPVLSWLCPDDERRLKVLPGWFDVITRSLSHHRAIHLSTDDAGAAVWVPPGVPMVEDDEAFGSAMVNVSPVDAERFGTLIGKAEAVHPEEPHWYLFFVGVVPDRQGQGLGRRSSARCLIAATATARPPTSSRHGPRTAASTNGTASRSPARSSCLADPRLRRCGGSRDRQADASSARRASGGERSGRARLGGGSSGFRRLSRAQPCRMMSNRGPLRGFRRHAPDRQRPAHDRSQVRGRASCRDRDRSTVLAPVGAVRDVPERATRTTNDASRGVVTRLPVGGTASVSGLSDSSPVVAVGV